MIHPEVCPRCDAEAPTEAHDALLCPAISDEMAADTLTAVRRAVASGWDEVEALGALVAV